MTASNGIQVDSYVLRADGTPVSFDELEDGERVRAATQLKCQWLNGLFMGKAEFAPERPDTEKREYMSAGG